MTDLIVVPQATPWQKLKALVLDSVSSPITRRVYNLGLDEFITWYALEPRPGFTKATVCSWRVALEARGLGTVSINVRITAVRKLAVEAADNGLLAPELANGIARVSSSAADHLSLRRTHCPRLRRERKGRAFVALVPQEEALVNEQFLRQCTADKDGRCEVANLRPGNYYAFAFDRIDTWDLFDAEFLRTLI